MQFLADPSCPLICNIRLLSINIMLIFLQVFLQKNSKGISLNVLRIPRKILQHLRFCIVCRTLALFKLSNTYLVLRLWKIVLVSQHWTHEYKLVWGSHGKVLGVVVNYRGRLCENLLEASPIFTNTSWVHDGPMLAEAEPITTGVAPLALNI